MHRVEIRLTHEGDDPSANFEVFTEALKNGAYTELAPMRSIASGSAPVVMFLEANERVVVVAKADQGRMVFDREQNANVRIESEVEVEQRKQREANLTKSQADQAVRSAEARVGKVAGAANQAERAANADVKNAQAEAAKSTAPISEGASAPRPVPTPPRMGAPASANTGPVDSEQVKKNG